MPDDLISTNFFSLEEQDIIISIFKKECQGQEAKKDFPFPVKKFLLPDAINNGEKINYFIAFEPHDNFSESEVSSLECRYLTIWYLSYLIETKLKDLKLSYEIKDNYLTIFDFVIDVTNLGKESICIIPTYQNRKYGILLEYHFFKNKDVPYSIEIQKKSLSLDQAGQANKNYYIDKYKKIEHFSEKYFNLIFRPLDKKGVVNISGQMEKIKNQKLATKRYVFGGNNQSNSQFQGILKNGPYLALQEECTLVFIFRNHEKSLSHEVYYALKGERFSTFAGMEKMFNYKMHKETIKGIGIEDYNETEIDNLINGIVREFNSKKIVPIILVPWTRDTASDYQSKMYYLMKYKFLKYNMPCQFVGIDKVRSYNAFKWSVSGIALQIFTKLGGSPWCLVPSTEKCLIIGIGQAHRKNEQGGIARHYSYSIQNDSSGLFRNIKLLSDNTDNDKYLNGLAENLKEIIINQISQFDCFVLHTSFRLRNDELKTIRRVIESLSNETGKEFAVLRFNDSHYYMGYDFNNNNSLIPYESTLVRITANSYLIWFEGVQYGYSSVKQRIGPPIQVSVDFSTTDDYNNILRYFQDAINLSGANWRGFNAKSMPVSILYAHLLSGFISAFDAFKFGDLDIENITPWFL